MENNNNNNNIESSSALNLQGDFNINNNDTNETDVNPQEVKLVKSLRGNKEVKSSEALRKAKAKYYQKKKQDEAYMNDMRERAYAWYKEHKALPNAIPRRRRIKETEVYFPDIITA